MPRRGPPERKDRCPGHVVGARKVTKAVPIYWSDSRVAPVTQGTKEVLVAQGGASITGYQGGACSKEGQGGTGGTGGSGNTGNTRGQLEIQMALENSIVKVCSG